MGAATAAGALRGSPKPHNEDTYLVERLGGGATLVAVCDGHGLSGHLAAQHVSAQLAAAVRSAAGDASGSSDESDSELAPSKQATNLGSPTALAVPPAAALGLSSPAAAKGCLREAFRLVAESVVAAAAAGANACDFAHSGATAVACLVLEDRCAAGPGPPHACSCRASLAGCGAARRLPDAACPTPAQPCPLPAAW